MFGFEEFWPKVYAQFKGLFDAIADLGRLGDAMVKTAEESAAEPVKNVICALTRATMAGACEAVLLCGNGCGTGAIKIVRGMYESRWTAEYLRRHPEEVEDYLEFSKVTLWRRIHWLQENSPGDGNRVSAEEMKRMKNDYNQAKARFKNELSWSKKSIREIAVEIGRTKEYELPYAIACSIHHANFEGLSALFTSDNGETIPNPPPSEAWVKTALISTHANLWFAFGTLNDSCGLDFRERLDATQQAFSRTWKEQRPDSEELKEKLRGGAE